MRAAEVLTGGADLRTGDRAGVLFNPEQGASMSGLAGELQGVMRAHEPTAGTRVEMEMDEFETGWIVLGNRSFEHLVASIQALSENLFERGNGNRLLAAVLRFDFERKPAYWIYNYKRGYFYPLVLGADKGRDHEAELRLGELMEREKVPIESSLERWFGLSGIPF